MAEEANDLKDALLGLAGKWTAYTAFGTFILYLFGYLALRFQLSTYGVATDLDVLDEKYLFAGSRFFVFLISSVANLLLIVALPALLGYILYKLLPARAKQWAHNRDATRLHRGPLLLIVGVAFALLFIQLVLRKCFVLGNLLLAHRLPGYEWISSILLAPDSLRSLYFTGLVGGCLFTGTIALLAFRAKGNHGRIFDVFLGLLVFLFSVEFLLLPVNYGVLIATQQLPRVMEVSDQALPDNQQAWLVWENKDVLTYLVRGRGDQRMLMTVPRKENKIKIVAYEDIFQILFAGAQPASLTGDTQ